MSAIPAEMEARLREVERDANTSLTRMDGHEKLCAERYNGIIATHQRLESGLGRISGRLISIGILLLAGMAGILIKLVFFS